MWKLADNITISEVVTPLNQSSLQEAVDRIGVWPQENRLQLKSIQRKGVRLCCKRTPLLFIAVELDGC